jgi:hypothetical protein
LEEDAPVERGAKDGAWPERRVDGGVKSDADRVRAGGVGVGVSVGVGVGVSPGRSLERVRGDAGVEAFDRLTVRDEEEVGVGETGSSSWARDRFVGAGIVEGLRRGDEVCSCSDTENAMTEKKKMRYREMTLDWVVRW